MDKPYAMPMPRRHLVGFDPRELPHHFADVLVIGGGIAGFRAALGIPDRYRVLVVTKDEVRESNSHYAQGGIAGVLDPEDRFDNHIADTLAAGKGLCDPAVVEMVVREAPVRIGELIEWGTHFDEVNGHVALGSRRRTLPRPDRPRARRRDRSRDHARDHPARPEPSQRPALANCFSIDLLTHEGRCRGVLVWNRNHGLSLVWARAVVLATGGAGQLFRETTNPPIATADGHAMAFRAGAELGDMEFMQFHPTVLYIAGSTRHLMTEALRGEGAYLRDCNGERFMPAYHRLAELAPRDDVSLAISAQMAKTQHPSVYLDLSHLDAERIRRRFPGIDRLCRTFELDITHDPIPVCPGAHYMIGGVTRRPPRPDDPPGPLGGGARSPAPAFTAPIGWPSNSLIEGLVYGCPRGRGSRRRTGRGRATPPGSAAPGRGDLPRRPRADRRGRRARVPPRPPLATHGHHPRRLRAGRGGGSRRPVEPVHPPRSSSTTSPVGPLQNMLIVARLMIVAADARRESRGVHFRRDFPQADPALNHHIKLQSIAPGPVRLQEASSELRMIPG